MDPSKADTSGQGKRVQCPQMMARKGRMEQGEADVVGRGGEGAGMVGWIQAQKLGDQCLFKVAGHLVRSPSKKVNRVSS